MIPLVDLPAQYQSLRGDIDAAVARVLKSGRYVLGPEVEAFEAEFAQVCEAPHAVGVNSGTNALYLSLLAAGVGPGDEVITVPYTFAATIAAVRATRASVRLIDIAPRSLTLDADRLEREITSRTKAVIPVHLFGQPADMDPIVDVARRHNLTIVEDACQAHGASYKGRPVGGLGDLACFSFYPSKNLGTCGEGGIVLTQHAELAETVRQLRSWGPVRLSGNYRLAALAAAILRVKLPHLDRWTTRRRANRRPVRQAPGRNRTHPTRSDAITRAMGFMSTPCGRPTVMHSRTRYARAASTSRFTTGTPSIGNRHTPTLATRLAPSRCPSSWPLSNYPFRSTRSSAMGLSRRLRRPFLRVSARRVCSRSLAKICLKPSRRFASYS